MKNLFSKLVDNILFLYNQSYFLHSMRYDLIKLFPSQKIIFSKNKKKIKFAFADLFLKGMCDKNLSLVN